MDFRIPAATEQLRPTVTAQAAARQYASEFGWRMFATHGVDEAGECTCGRSGCESAGKHPATPHGLKDATADHEQLAQLWARPGLNVAVSCGDSGLWVFDVDARSNGLETLERLIAEHGELPATPTCETGGGGLHFYFRLGEQQHIKSRSGVAEGCDVKSRGGYVLLPPSQHASGNDYRWRDGLSPWQVEPAEAPVWLLRLVMDKEKGVETVPHLNSNSRDEGGAIREGGRNATLTSCAGSMRRKGMSREAILAALLVQNQEQCNPPLDAGEVEQIAASVASYEPAAEDELQLGPAVGKGLTDAGNAERFAAKFGARVRYDHSRGQWYVWSGKRWAPNSTGEVMRLAKQLAKSIYAEAEHAGDDTEAKAIAAHARASQSRARLEAMLVLAQSELPIATTHETFDADPYLLGADNGTIHLRTGELREHRPDDFLTTSTCVEYPAEPGIEAPLWLSFLGEIFAGDCELIGYVQRLLGQALIGRQLEHVLGVFWGNGCNGKSVLLNVVLDVLGDYGLMGAQGLLMASRNEQHPTALCDLHKRRLVVIQETNQGQRFNEALLKSISGGDRIRARQMRQDFWEFEPTHSAILVTNHKPQVRGDDVGVWRRLKLVPFLVQIPPERQDAHLTEKLKAESPAILKWLVEGALAWQREGLNEPPIVRDATEAYRVESDNVARWLDEETYDDPGAELKSSELLKRYRLWCDLNGEKPLSHVRFGERLGAKYARQKLSKGVFYTGLNLCVNV